MSIQPPETAEENAGDHQNITLSSPPAGKTLSESPRRDNLVMVTDNNIALMKSRWSFSSSMKSFGSSRDEMFFDSYQYQWLQSDSEDDFHSVNGDFIPSLGSTPKTSFSERNHPRFRNPLFEEEIINPPLLLLPRRKKLGELFRDSIREEREDLLIISEESSEQQSDKSKITTTSEDNSGELKTIDQIDNNLKSPYQQHQRRCLPKFTYFKGSLLLMEKRKRKKKMIRAKSEILSSNNV